MGSQALSVLGEIYDGLAPDDVTAVRDAAVRIKLRMRRTAEDIIEIGRDLIMVKERLGHGNFLPWIEAEFGMSVWTADRFINVAETLGSKLSTVHNLPPTVLYALAAPSTPEEVRDNVIELAGKGEKVTAEVVRKLKAELAQATKSGGREIRSLSRQNKQLSKEGLQLRDQVASLEIQVRDFEARLGVKAAPINPRLEALRMMWDFADVETRRAFLREIQPE